MEEVLNQVKEFEQSDSVVSVEIPNDCDGHHVWEYSGMMETDNTIMDVKECIVCGHQAAIQAHPNG